MTPPCICTTEACFSTGCEEEDEITCPYCDSLDKEEHCPFDLDDLDDEILTIGDYFDPEKA